MGAALVSPSVRSRPGRAARRGLPTLLFMTTQSCTANPDHSNRMVTRGVVELVKSKGFKPAAGWHLAGCPSTKTVV